MTGIRFLVVVVLVFLSGCGGPGDDARSVNPPSRSESPKFEGANILLITLDTTRADRIGSYGYESAETPRLDALASQGTLFEQCITPSAFTLPSHSSIMTGLYPPYHGVRLNGGSALADVHQTLAEQLSSSGYRTGAFVAAFVLDRRWGLGQGFDHYDDDFDLEPDQQLDLSRVQRPADTVVGAALDWLDEGNDERPFFAWVHLYDPHTPYDPPEPYRTRFASSGETGLYDGEIAFTDSQVGRALDWLAQRGLSDNTIVAVVGDHGEALGEHGEDEHGFFIYDNTVKVPFILRIPGIKATKVTSQVRTVDLAPTLADLLGVPATAECQGESLVPLILDPASPGPRYAYSESMAVNLQYGWSALYSLRTIDYKFIDAPRAELFELKKDPSESQNLFPGSSEIAEQMKGELDRLREDIAEGAPETQDANLDEDTLAMLASLGYVGGGEGAVTHDGDLADPKDKIHLFESVAFAAHLIGEEDHDRAAHVLEIVLDDDPEIPQAQLLLASTYRKLARDDEARVILETILKRDPDSVRALTTMASILSDEGNTDEVLAICRRALAVDDRNTQALEIMASVFMTANDHQGAEPHLRKVVEVQPKLTRSRNNLAACLIGLGSLPEAEDMLTAILGEFPKFPMASFHLGLLREGQGRFDDARRAYETEIENHKSSVAARFNLGNLMLRAGDPAAAAGHMRQLIQDAPDEPRPYLMLARITLGSQGDLNEVERLAKAGLERTEASDLKALGNFLLADVYSRQGRQAELEEAVERGQHFKALAEQGAQGN